MKRGPVLAMTFLLAQRRKRTRLCQLLTCFKEPNRRPIRSQTWLVHGARGLAAVGASADFDQSGIGIFVEPSRRSYKTKRLLLIGAASAAVRRQRRLTELKQARLGLF